MQALFHLYYEYVYENEAWHVIEYDYKHEKCRNFYVIELSTAIKYLQASLPYEADYALRCLTPQE